MTGTRGTRSGVSSFLWTVAIGLTIGACGEDKQGVVTTTDVTDASEETLTGPCDNGDRACQGQTPATCTEGVWVLDDAACTGLEPWCLDGGCVACSPGVLGCGANTPRECAADGTWVYSDPCPANEPLCLDGACVQCSPGQERCHPAGTALQRCDESGVWVTLSACDFGCSEARCSGTCAPGQGRCDLAVPSRCDVTGTWIPGDECTGDTPLCLDGQCVVCTPGAVDCDGAEARTCSKNGIWETTETCPFACVDGACLGVCVPDSVGCDDKVPKRCDATGQWDLAAEECAYGCENGECVGECRPSTVRCFGDAPAACGEDLLWDTAALCAQPTPDCNLGACRCAPEKTLCNDGAACVNLQNDTRNCGSCGHDCLGGACEAGMCRPIVLATGQSNPTGLVVDDSRVYWTNFAAGGISAGSIRSIPKGGGVVAIVASEVNAPTYLAASETDLFWTTSGSGNVQTTPKVGGNIVNIASAINGPFGVAYANGTVYFGSSNLNSVFRVSATGGPVTTLATGQATVLALAVDTDLLYWVNGAFGNPNSTVMRLGTGSLGPPEIFAFNQTRPTALSFDDSHVYWMVWNGAGADAIRRCPKTGCVGDPQTVVSGLQLSGGSNAMCFAVDALHVYWSNQATSSVHRVPKGGGTPVVLATGQPAANCVQQDSTAIYWTNFSGGNIMRLAK